MSEKMEEVIKKVNHAKDLLADARLIMQRLDDNAYKTDPFGALRTASNNLERFFDLLKKEGEPWNHPIKKSPY